MMEKVLDIKNTLDQVEEKLKDVLHESCRGYGTTYQSTNEQRLTKALEDVQNAITKLLLIK